MPDIRTPEGRLAFELEIEIRRLLSVYETEVMRFPKGITVSLGPHGMINGVRSPRVQVIVEP